MKYMIDVYDITHTKLTSTYIKCGKIWNGEFWQSLEFKELCRNYNKLIPTHISLNLGATRDFRFNIRYLQKHPILIPFIKFASQVMRISYYEYLKLGLASLDIVQQAGMNKDRF